MAEELEQPGEPGTVGRALLGVAAAIAKSDPHVPAMGEERPGFDLPGLNESLHAIAASRRLSGVVKTQVLAKVFAATGRRTPALESLAESLVNPEFMSSETIDRIFETAGSSTLLPGRDLLHRVPADLIDKTSLVERLLDDVADFLVVFEPVDCDADHVVIDGTVALSISTTGYTNRSLSSLESLVDPLAWPDCDLQHLFFESMTRIAPEADLAKPDRSLATPPQPLDNWKGPVREVVDWSFSGGAAGWATFTTNLDFVVFRRPERIGCTYDILLGGDLEVTIDQGYLIAEDLGVSDLRRIRTLKQVHFAVGDVDPRVVCCYWGPVMQMIAWACAGQ